MPIETCIAKSDFRSVEGFILDLHGELIPPWGLVTILNWRSFSFYPVTEHLVCFLSFTLHCPEIRVNLCMFNFDKRHKGSVMSLLTLFGPTSKTLWRCLLSVFLARTKSKVKRIKGHFVTLTCNLGHNSVSMKSSHFSTPNYNFFFPLFTNFIWQLRQI